MTGFVGNDAGMTDDAITRTPASKTALADDDPRAVFARAAGLAEAVIEAVPIDRLGEPTPSGMAVSELLEHLVVVLRRVACVGRGEDPWQAPVDASDVAADGFADAWRDAARQVQAAWNDDGLLERQTALPWGTFPGAEVLAVFTNEITVHTWDLAETTAQSPGWDEAVVAVADAAIRAQLPLADRTDMWAAASAALPPGVDWKEPFANAVEIPPDANAIDRLVAWNGRQP